MKKIISLLDVCNFCMALECDELNEKEIIEGFQHLIDNGVVWRLQGHYGKMAQSLIESGSCHPAQP